MITLIGLIFKPSWGYKETREHIRLASCCASACLCLFSARWRVDACLREPGMIVTMLPAGPCKWLDFLSSERKSIRIVLFSSSKSPFHRVQVCEDKALLSTSR